MKLTNRCFVLSMGLLGLVGCAGVVERPQRPTFYDLGPPAVLVAQAQAARAEPPLVLPEIEAVGVLDSSAILYRLDYADDRQLRAYSLARWAAPAAQIVRQRIRHRLAAGRAVLSPEEGAALVREHSRPYYVLRLELEEFTHLFDEPQRSRGVLRLRATLLANTPAGDRLLGQRLLSADGVAPSADASGGVRALATAVDAVAADLGVWLKELRAP